MSLAKWLFYYWQQHQHEQQKRPKKLIPPINYAYDNISKLRPDRIAYRLLYEWS